MAKLVLKHRAQTIPPDTKPIKDEAVKGPVDETLRGIQESNKNIFDDLKNISAQLPQDTGVIYFGDPTTNGTWRIIVSGLNLSVQLLEASVWNEKSAFTP